MADPLLLWENIFADADGTLTSQGAAAGFPVENVIDWRTATAYRWKRSSAASGWIKIDLGSGNTAQPDTVAIAGHNIFSAGGNEMRVESSTDDFAAVTVNEKSVTIVDDNPYLATFTASGAFRYWRVRFLGTFTAAPQVGVVTLGRKLDIPEGAQPNLDPYNFAPNTEWTQNASGSMLGADHRYIARQFSLDYDGGNSIAKTDFFQPASGPTFDEQLWDGGTEESFLDHAKSKPFWFAWNITEEMRMAFVCRVTSAVRMPFVNTTNRRALRMTIEAAGQN